jgi:DNA-binding NarL/FixJ family response regulator
VPVTVLLVDGEPGALAERAAGLPQFDVLTAAGREDALRVLGTRRVDAIVSQLKLPDGSGLDLVKECAEKYPEPRRILLAAYEDLPEIVQARTRGLVSRVIPLGAPPDRIARAVGEALSGGDDLSVSKSIAHGVAWQELDEVLRWTAARLAQVKGSVVRPLPPDARALQLQFVLQGGKRVEALRKDVVKQWLWPVKPRDAQVARKDRKHPVVQMLGGVSPQSEVYVKHLPGERVYAYLVLLPWQHENKITAALGLLPEKAFRNDYWELLVAVHAEAVSELSEFALPRFDEEASGVGHAIPEYDWIVTPDYVGPDRRTRPTSFFNRFIFLGRRKRVPSRIARATESFTDVPPPHVWRYAAAYVVLALIDTVLTWICVRAGLVQEANPLLRPLVLHHPWWFLAVKNALAVLAFVAVIRFQLFRFGMWALRAAVTAYFLLDVYWAVLLRNLR